MKFLDPLVVEHLDGDGWRLWFEFRCIAEDGRAIYVPAGYKTDMLSIPRAAWVIIPPTGRGGKAGVLHDWVLTHMHLTRAQCADYFLEALLSLNVDDNQADLMFAMVRAYDLRVGEEG